MKTNLPAKWFRMYSELATDPKIQMLSEQDQRRYTMLLCLRCSNGDVTLHDSEVAFQLRISEEEFQSTKALLLSKNLITVDCKPTAWDKRQYASDSSAARVAEHRKRKNEQCNVTETKCNAPETETETEKTLAHLALELVSKKPVAEKLSKFAEFWSSYPRKKNKGDAEKAWQALHPNIVLVHSIMTGLDAANNSADWKKDGGKYIPYPASWLRAKGWEDDDKPTPTQTVTPFDREAYQAKRDADIAQAAKRYAEREAAEAVWPVGMAR